MASVPLWLHLDKMPVRAWDEAKNAVHAIEMFQNHEFFVRSRDGVPDQTGVKPPLLIWFQVFGLHAFGYNEIALRWISTAAALGTLCLGFWFLAFRMKRFTAAVFFPLILVTIPAYLGPHMARTGDHDSLLIFFISGGVWQYFLFLQEHQRKNLRLAMLLFTLATLTKSIAGLMILPGMLVYTFLTGNLKKILSTRDFYLGLLLSLTLITGIYAMRESADPGYLLRVWNDELFPRYFNFSKNYDYQRDSFWYYFRNFPERLGIWIWALIPAALMWMAQWKEKSRSLRNYLAWCAGFFMFVISAGTKNFWYDGPVLPIMALFIALSIEDLFLRVQVLSRNGAFAGMLLILLAITAFPYRSAIHRVINEDEHWWDRERYGLSYHLREIIKSEETPPDEFKILYTDDIGYLPWLFYQKTLPLAHPGTEAILTTLDSIEIGDHVICSQEEHKEALLQEYECELQEEVHTSGWYEVVGER